ncbi:hypothetical protein QUF56_04305 [Ureibacillus composti]|nr:hypothetical protein [Ureibacillus composti]
MRIHSQMSIDSSSTPTSYKLNSNVTKEVNTVLISQKDEQKRLQKEISPKVIEKLNEFMEFHN